MRQGGEKAGGRDNRGMALVITLLVVALLTAVVVEFAYGVYISTNALHNWQAAQRLSLAAKSATRLGARLITENALLYPSIRIQARWRLSRRSPLTRLTVPYCSELKMKIQSST